MGNTGRKSHTEQRRAHSFFIHLRAAWLGIGTQPSISRESPFRVSRGASPLARRSVAARSGVQPGASAAPYVLVGASGLGGSPRPSFPGEAAFTCSRPYTIAEQRSARAHLQSTGFGTRGQASAIRQSPGRRGWLGAFLSPLRAGKRGSVTQPCAPQT